MENRTGYNLNAAVQQWRQELAEQPGLALEDRLELETHLRETIAELRSQGLNDEEAFWLARRRTGQPGQLAGEFVKADSSRVSRKRMFLRMFAWSLAAWLSLAGLVFALSGDLEKTTWRWWVALAMPLMTAFCAWRALRTGAVAGRWARVIFWIGTVAGIALFALAFRYQGKILTQADDRHLLMVSGILPVLVLMLAGIREVRLRGLKVFGFGLMSDIAGGAAGLAILLMAAYFVWLERYVEPLRLKAEKRWAEIGRPMPEFKKTMQPIAENESLRELTQDSKPFGVVTFYKFGSGGGRITQSNAINSPKEIFDILQAVNDEKPAGDSIKLPAKASEAMDGRSDDFNSLYKRILQREPPVWDIDPSGGSSMLVPNFLTLRWLAQSIAVDAYHRLERGDEKGASDAVAAGRRMTEKLGEEPLLVSFMIRVSIEGLYAMVSARLPEEPGGMQRLAGDVEAERGQFKRTVQANAWSFMHTLEETHPKPEEFKDIWEQHSFPQWLQRSLLLPVSSRTFFRFECSKAWLFAVDVIGISGRARNLADSDLGEKEIEESAIRNESIFTPNLLRAWLRLNSVLLLREQAELIRSARAQMQAGKSGDLGGQQSVVIPGSKWEITGDAVAGTITLKLTPLPKWTTDNEVTTNEFWLLPLDGSKPWKLGAVPRPALSSRD